MRKNIQIQVAFGLLCFFFIYFQTSYSQNNKVDSLNQLLLNADDTSKVDVLNQLFQLYEYTDLTKANKCITSAIDIAEKNGYNNGLINSYISAGYFAEDTGNYAQSLEWHQKALAVAKKINSQSRIAACYQNIANINMMLNNYQQAFDNAQMALTVYQRIDDKKGLAKSYNTIGNINLYWGNYVEAINHFTKSLHLNEEQGNKKGMAASYNNLGIINYEVGNFPEALKNDFAALKIHEDLGNKKGVADLYVCIGNVYHKQGNYLEALRNFYASLDMCKEIGDKNVAAMNYNNIGNVFQDLGNYDEALKNLFEALKIKKQLSDKSGLGSTYNAIGVVYMEQGKYPEAIVNFEKSISLKKTVGNIDKLANSYINMASVYLKIKNYKQAKYYLDLSLQLASKMLNKQQLKEIYNGLAELNRAEGNWKQAYIYNDLFVKYKDSLINDENTLETIRLQLTYEYEKRENIAKAEQYKKDVLAGEEKARQRMFLLFVMAGLAIVLFFSIILFNRWRITTRQKKIIEEQKNIVDVAFHELETKNKEITDSINYASRIQNALLTSYEYISGALSSIKENKAETNFFIFYQPKDIVSGDFYWAFKDNFTEVEENSVLINGLEKQKDYFYLVVADCTGHGVPGAFMSLLNINFLNENIIEHQISQPAKVLNQQRFKIIKALNPNGTENSKDGMDCVLCRFDFDTLTLTYASAYNPLWIVRRDAQLNKLTLIEFKGDKMPVGKHNDLEKDFVEQTIQLQKGDCVYAFTDGYADQFGGPAGKKFKYKQFENLLVSINERPMNEQCEVLKTVINDWKGPREQVDDILVVGVKI